MPIAKRKLRVVDDDFKLLVGQIDDGNAAHLGRLQSLLGKGGDLFVVLNDVDLFAAQFADDRLHAHALHADAGADRVDVLVAGHDCDLGALAGFAGDGADHDRVVVDLGNFGLEEVRNQLGSGAGDDDLRTLGGAIYLEQHDANAFADGELLQARLLTLGHAGFSFAEVDDDVLTLDALDGGGENFFFAVGVLVEYGIALGFAHLLEDDLLGQLRGDAAERARVLVEADFAARLELCALGHGLGFFERDLVDGIFDLVFRRP